MFCDLAHRNNVTGCKGCEKYFYLWCDIPYICTEIGWRNIIGFPIISKRIDSNEPIIQQRL